MAQHMVSLLETLHIIQFDVCYDKLDGWIAERATLRYLGFHLTGQKLNL
jgi:hypothetical protein